MAQAAAAAVLIAWSGLTAAQDAPRGGALPPTVRPLPGSEPALAARTGEARELSLAEALGLAEAAGETVRAAAAEVVRAGGEHRQTRSQRWPQLFGSGSYTRTLASEFEDLDLDFGDGAGEGDLGDLPFGQRNQYRLGLQLEQTLWSGGRVAGQTAAAGAAIAVAEANLAAARAALALEVTEAYFDAQLFDQLARITQGTLELAETAYRHTRLAFEVGNQSEFDLLRAQVARDNQRPELLQRRADRELAYLRLKQLLDLPAREAVVLTTGFAEQRSWPAVPPPTGPEARQAWLEDLVERRSPVRQARALLVQREQLLRAARAERWPSLALSSDYGRVAYPAGGVAALDEMRTNWTVGVGFRVPLLTGGRLAGQVISAQAAVDEARARLDQVRELARLDAQEAVERLAAAAAVWEASAGTAEQANRAYGIADLRYREGLSTQLELSDARLLLQQALGIRALAARNLQVARARVALLPDLPLGGGAPLLVPPGALTSPLATPAAGPGFTTTIAGGGL